MTSWKPEFKVGGDWCGNAQRFATEKEALATAMARFERWTIPSDYRATRSEDPVNYKRSNGQDRSL